MFRLYGFVHARSFWPPSNGNSQLDLVFPARKVSSSYSLHSSNLLSMPQGRALIKAVSTSPAWSGSLLIRFESLQRLMLCQVFYTVPDRGPPSVSDISRTIQLSRSRPCLP